MQNNNEKSKNDIKERVYKYALETIKLVDDLERKGMSAGVIARQLVRSATSVGANIVEAQAGRTRKDFANFLSHALKSANESKFWIGLLRDSGKIPEDTANVLLQESKEIANILGSSIITLKNGKKF